MGTTATGTTPTSNSSTTRTTAADTTSMKQTMETISTITAKMVTETTTATASTPAPALKTIMMAAADTRAMTKNIDVGTNARMSMADTTTITTARRPADMKRPTPREGGRGHRGEDGMCGIATHTPNMATRLERITEEVIKATKHLAQKKESSPQGTKAIEQHLATIEREEMAGIIERPAKLKSKYNRLAENRFAALSEDEEEKHGGYSTVNDLCATNKARGNKTKNDLYATNKARGNGNNNYYRNMNMAKKK